MQISAPAAGKVGLTYPDGWPACTRAGPAPAATARISPEMARPITDLWGASGQRVGSVSGSVGSVTGLMNATIADAIWDELLAAHAISGSAGEALAGAGGGGGSDPGRRPFREPTRPAPPDTCWARTWTRAISSRSDFDASADQVDVGSIATAVAQAIADEVLARGVAGVEDTANAASLAAIILATLESSISGTTWTIRKTGGGTFATKTVTTDGAALPIVGVD
ncbi:MAG: hypothetical protein H6661_10045 [Ardenticatenaceae bacterium]|nr:hypothetical protein [Ardenticatenaceae bacterium]